MPTAAQLITNIRSLALVGTTGPGDLARVETYMNMAYRDVYEKVAERYPWFVQETEDVAITDGHGEFVTQPLHILSVYDTVGKRFLDPTDIAAVEQKDPEFTSTGNPSEFYVLGFDQLCSWPQNDTTLRVRFTPNASILTNDSTEADIKLQPIHHDVLTWGTLKLMAYDERDKVVGAELTFNQQEMDRAEDRMWRWFDAHAPKKSKPVKSYML
ncbi:hypothetical protein [Bradyrhizobium manausense]|uniref:phage adaptor protein n=1 Tax=Bradyrhizobium manausense TaxID=989370 RepID=UPI001BAD91DE|nr:hypothetical protein [Bradyrhizobium manausense]MBR0721768.1 hypothetical protein [Bradyrhizobium manausense]